MSSFKTGLLILFVPPDGFRAIKRDRDHFRWVGPIVLYLLTVAARVFNIFFTSYPLRSQAPEETNFLQVILTVLVPLMLWVVGCYLVTTILSGESMFREVFAATSYAALPAVILTVPLTLMSKVLSSTSAGVYQILWVVVFMWCGLLALIGISVMNSYSIKKTLAVTGISLFACVFLVTIIALLYVLGMRVVNFVQEVISEYRLLLVG